MTNETTYGTLTAVTATGYDSQGRAVSQTDVLGNAVSTAYDRAGNVTAQWGATYPVAYAYDTRGRRIAMATTRDDTFDFAMKSQLHSILNPNSSSTWRWCYDAAYRVTHKQGVRRWGARPLHLQKAGVFNPRVVMPLTASYAYDALGQLTNVHYSDNTPRAISFAYDRLGRMVSAITAVSSHLFEYAGLDLAGEIQDGVAITPVLRRPRSFSRLQHRRHLQHRLRLRRLRPFLQRLLFRVFCVFARAFLRLPGTDLVASMTNSAGFWWRAHTSRPAAASSPTVSNHVNHVNPVLISACDYANDAAGRRVSRKCRHLRLQRPFEVIGAAIGTNSYGYAHVAIGNRVWSAVNTLTNTYTANRLNQYTAVTPPIAVAYDADGSMTYLGE